MSNLDNLDNEKNKNIKNVNVSKLSKLPYDNILSLIEWFSSVELELPPPTEQIAEIAKIQTETLLNGLEYYMGLHDSYILLYRMLFAHYVVTSRIWSNNPYISKYKINNGGGKIIQSSTDGASSASAFMYKSLQDGDFVMADLVGSPYGNYVYQILEQMKTLIVTI